MSNLTQSLDSFLAQLHLVSILRALIIFSVGFFLARFVSNFLIRIVNHHATPHQKLLLGKASFYLILSLFVLAVLQELGFQLSLLLGTAGILTLAVGIAAQFCFANLISGLFLIFERPFEIGDTIVVDKFSGEVLSMDTLAIKIRTDDNTLVRIPNENLLKNPFTNLSHFPIRRVDFQITLNNANDYKKVEQALLSCANNNPFCLADPKPQVLFYKVNEGTVTVKFLVWGRNEDLGNLKNSLQESLSSFADLSFSQINS